MKKNLFVFILIGCTSLSFSKNFEKVKEVTLPSSDKLTEYKFENGLQVLLIPRHQANVLTYQTWFRVGSLHEKLDAKLNKTGLAHLFEHMMFRGTPKYPDGKFDSLSARMGADKQNATTYFYRTNYFQSIPAKKLDEIMELESDRMKNLNLIAPLLEKEKGAVVGERRRHDDNPMSLAWDNLLELVYATAPYRYTVLGTESEIKGFTVEEAQYFYKTFYAPNNCTLIVIGDFENDTMMSKISKYYGDMKAQEIPNVKMPVEAEQKKERFREISHPQATSELLIMAYPIPSVNEADIVPLNLLSTHLSTGMESRLRKTIVDKGIAVSASAELSSSPDLFELSASLTEKHKAQVAQKLIDKEIDLAKSTKISPVQFQRALNQELLGLYGNIADNQSLGSMLGEYLMLSGNYMRGFEIIEQYKKLTPADLQRVAKKYLNKEKRSVVIVHPAKKEGKK